MPIIANHLTLSFDERSALFEGRTTGYPAFEAYVQVGNRLPITLFQAMHAKGASPLNLLAGATKPISAKISF
ncbi:hypothetical protein [Chloroherpeton thalassium]|uniref:hypothetical protein n=1 Tax=Chloroherpeton thalassium TaxID=100716 RepID=UPI0002F44DC8|nr:hypothetical protein [Chloroherpeton thalassium]